MSGKSGKRGRKPLCSVGLVFLLFLLPLFVFPGRTSAQSIVGAIPISGGNPRGLAVDSDRSLVYAAVRGADQIAVIDGASNTIVRTIDVGDDVEGIALDPAANRLYAGYSRPIHVIDAASGNEIGQIKESIYGENEIAINPTNHKLYLADWTVFVGWHDKVLIYDGSSLAKIGQVDLGLSDKIERIGVAVNPVTGMAYATYTGSGSVFFIGGESNQIERTVALQEHAQDWVAVNPATNRVYVQCTSSTVVLDGSTGAKLGVIPGYHDIAVNSAANRIYLAMNKRFSVVDGATNTVVGSLTLPQYKGTGGIGCLPDLGRVYVALGYFADIVVIQDVAAPVSTPTATRTATSVPTATRTATPQLGHARHLPLILQSRD